MFHFFYSVVRLIMCLSSQDVFGLKIWLLYELRRARSRIVVLLNHDFFRKNHVFWLLQVGWHFSNFFMDRFVEELADYRENHVASLFKRDCVYV
jgi:hypothetical protein